MGMARGPAAPMMTDQKSAGRSRAAQRQYLRGADQKSGAVDMVGLRRSVSRRRQGIERQATYVLDWRRCLVSWRVFGCPRSFAAQQPIEVGPLPVDASMGSRPEERCARHRIILAPPLRCHTPQAGLGEATYPQARHEAPLRKVKLAASINTTHIPRPKPTESNDAVASERGCPALCRGGGGGEHGGQPPARGAGRRRRQGCVQALPRRPDG